MLTQTLLVKGVLQKAVTSVVRSIGFPGRMQACVRRFRRDGAIVERRHAPAIDAIEFQ